MTRLSYAFGGEGNARTAEELARERVLVEALMGRNPAPKNLGEGLSALGEAFGYRLAKGRLAKDEGVAKSGADELFGTKLLSLLGGTKTINGPGEAQPTTYNTDPVDAPTPEASFGETFLPKIQSSTPAVDAEQAYDPNAQPDMAQAQPIPEPMAQSAPQQMAQAAPPQQDGPSVQALIQLQSDPRFQHFDKGQMETYRMMLEQAVLKQQHASDPVYQQQLKNSQLEYDQKLHPDQVPLTALQKAQVQKLTTPDTTSQDEAGQIGDAIINGDQPPELTGLYKQSSHVRAYLARKGYNLTNAKEDWQAQQKYLATLNGPQQVRLRQAVDFAFHSLPIIKGLAEEWKAGQYPALNAVQLEAAKQGALGQDAQRIATQLSSQIADMTSELGTVYKGGNSSTDESLRLAGENLKANWSEETLLAGIELVGKNLQIRRNSINSGSPMGAGTRYQQQPAPYDAPPVAADVPPAAEEVYDADGNRIQ